MLKETNLNNKQKPIILLDEFEKEKLIKLTGILTSGIRTRESSNTPYYAFFRKDNENRHSLKKCQETKCRDCEIPIIFRWRKYQFDNPQTDAIYSKPWQLKKGTKAILAGQWAKSDHSSRPSFTVYFYQLTNE